MRRIFVSKALTPYLTTLFTLALSFNAFGFEIDIDVAPHVLNLASQGKVVTVHTNIAYASVQATSVLLNDKAISWWKVDHRGNFVAKFEMSEIETLDGLVIGDYNTLVLTGLTTDAQPEAFFGQAEVLVVDNDSGGKQKREQRLQPITQPGRH